MSSRILIVSNNASMPYDAAQQLGAHVKWADQWRRCPGCCGDGYQYTEPFNPSERPQRVVCDECNGEGVFRK